MIAAIRAWLATRAIALLCGALAVALIGAAVQSWRVSSLKADNAKLRGEVKTAVETVKLSEAMRAQEQVQDKNSYADLSDRCEARVTTAIDAARAIHEVTNANVSNDRANAGADRAIVPASQLRRIIGQAQGGPVGLPAGSDRTQKP